MSDKACDKLTSDVINTRNNVNKQIRENLNKLSQRGESMVDLQKRAELLNLRSSSVEFRQKTARKFKRDWKILEFAECICSPVVCSVCCCLLVIVLIVLVLFLFILFVSNKS
jgi:hypothetical protein